MHLFRPNVIAGKYHVRPAQVSCTACSLAACTYAYGYPPSVQTGSQKHTHPETSPWPAAVRMQNCMRPHRRCNWLLLSAAQIPKHAANEPKLAQHGANKPQATYRSSTSDSPGLTMRTGSLR